MGKFRDARTVFKRKDVVREEYHTDELVGRDEEREQMVHALSPIVYDEQPNNIFLYGKTGVGKTISTKRVVEELQEEVNVTPGVDVETVWVSCQGRTGYRVAIETVNAMRDPSDQVPENGHSISYVIDELQKTIDEVDATHLLIVYDEIDELGSNDDLLYHLPRARSEGRVENTQIGLIGTCNDFRFRETLPPKVRSTLHGDEIHFAPYDAAELQEILQQRADLAFIDGALEGGVIPLTSALVADNTGDARRAISILKRAGEIAQHRNAKTVTEPHVRLAEEEVEKEIIKDELMNFGSHAILALYSTATRVADRDEKVQMREIYDQYQTCCDLVDREPRSKRTVQDHISEFSMMGFIERDEQNKGFRDGRVVYYDICIDTDAVAAAMRDDERFPGLVQ